MSRIGLIWAVLALWLVAMALSGAALLAAPEPDGFMPGLNRIIGFMGWQLAAAVLALLAWILAKPLPEGTAPRRLARVPGWWCVVLMAGSAVLVATNALMAGQA